MKTLENADDSPPPLVMPGWAIRVYVEVYYPDGSDALQMAILGLLRAKVPGMAGSLARELCIEESIVESVLKKLSEAHLIVPEPDGLSWMANELNDPEEQEIQRRMGWVFWDALRKRFLPELLLDDSGKGLRDLKNASSSSDDVAVGDLKKPKFGEIRNELMPTVEGGDFTIRDLDAKDHNPEMQTMNAEQIRRVSLHESGKSIQWHPLIVPYHVQPNLGSAASVYCNEPVSSTRFSEQTPYSPFLRSIIENLLPDSYKVVRIFAEKIQSEERIRHGAAFLAPYGGSERVMGEAQDEVCRMLGGEFPLGPFGSTDLIQSAIEAECDRLITAKLERSQRSLRASFSAVLQILGKVMADEMEIQWRNSPSASKLAERFPELRLVHSRHNRDEVMRQWAQFVLSFDGRNGLSIAEWNVGTPGDHLNKARRSWPLSQLGTVLRSWGAFAVVAENEPAGEFFLDWIKRSLRVFPELFQTFERVKEQRNIDKNSISAGVTLAAYRSDLYKTWRALHHGYHQAKKYH